ncbi:MAG: type II 3-dehydroquinate dehydratase [Hyphomicrobiaceae bacterium]
MAKPVFIINGPNLNMLGKREPQIYGSDTLDDIRVRLEGRAQQLGLTVDFRQSNSEGELLDWIHEARDGACALIINAGAYTHTSIALLDAIQASELACIEVHLSNIYRREEFRHGSYISKSAKGVICGFGAKGYELALEAVADIVGHDLAS